MSLPLAELPLPEHYDAAHATSFTYSPVVQKLLTTAVAWRRRHGIKPAMGDRRDVQLLLIDVQRDFCFPEGTLFVAGRSGTGALDDNRRTAEFIYRNLAALTRITTTLDTHSSHQIFFAAFWIDRDGNPLEPHREVSAEDVRSGAARPDPMLARWLTGGSVDALNAHALHYTSTLEKAGRYRLYLWPPHCLAGSPGHAIAGVIEEARLFHAFAREVNAHNIVKGENPMSENYSVLQPEVRTTVDGRPFASDGRALARTLLGSEVLIIGGQASSHCVMSSVDDLLTEIRATDPQLAGRIYLLTDCMSPVTVPDGKGGFLADFTPQADAALARFAEAGMHLVSSTDPMASWPGMS